MATLTLPPRSLAVLLAVVALAPSRPARLDAQQPLFKSGVDMVPLTVTVTDTAGKHVTGLTGGDFTVLEDGVEQPLSFFASERVPVDVALVLDTSGSMRSDLPLVQSAASGLIRGLRAADRGAIVEVKGLAGIPQPFTTDLAQVERTLRSLSTSGATALYDGLYVVLREFERERRASAQIRRQVLVLLSDGLDNTSRLSFDDVMDLARRVGVNIYVIALRGNVPLMPRADVDGSILRAEYTMGTVARESGGRAFFPKVARELPGIYGAIAQELASQYELGYMPSRPGGDGAFRRVSVRVRPHINAMARTRSGYYAPRTRAGI
jgi:Ca-activated chloride channel family protein